MNWLTQHQKEELFLAHTNRLGREVTAMTELVRVPDRARAGLEVEIWARARGLSYGTGYTPNAEHLMDMIEQALPERIRAMEDELLPVLGLAKVVRL